MTTAVAVEYADKYAGKQPAYGIAGHQRAVGRTGRKQGVEPGDTHAANPDQCQQRRRQGKAIAAEGAGQHIDEHLQELRCHNEPKADNPQLHHCFICVKQPQQRPGKNDNERAHRHGKGNIQRHAHLGNLKAACQVAGTVILAHKGGCRLRKGIEHTVDIDFHRKGRR